LFILNESFDVDYLQLRARWIRNMHKTADYAIDGMRIPYTLVWLVLEGTLHVVIDGHELRAVPGDLIMCPPNKSFSLIPRDSSETIHYLSMCAHMKIGNIDLVTLYGLPALAHLEPSAELEHWTASWKSLVISFDHFGALVSAHSDKTDSSEHAYVLHTDVSIHYLGLQGLLYQWLQMWLTQLRDRLPNEPLRFDHRVMKVCDYVRRHLGQRLRLQELGEHVHVSASHLSYLFAETLGISPMEYVRRTRLEAAREMLLNTDLTVKEIAECIGYEDQSQLSRAFGQAEGISPIGYRKASRRTRL